MTSQCDQAKPSCGACLRLDLECRPVQQALAFRNVVFEDASGRAGTTESSTSMPERLPQDVVQSSDGCSQPMKVTVQRQGLSPMALAPRANEDECTPCTEPTIASSTDVSVNGSSGDLSATPNRDEIILPAKRTPYQLVPCPSELLEPGHPTRKRTDGATFSPWTPRTRSSCTLMALFETMPATQDYYITSSYIDSWETECIPTLHNMFLRLQSSRDQSRVLEVAMKALAACQLSRRSFREQRSEDWRQPLSRTAPDFDHEAVAHHFYGAAMRKISQWSPLSPIPPSVAMAAMILFCCLESVMGNFKAFSLHSSGVQKMLEADMSHIGENGESRSGLLAAWTQAQMHNWWLRFHFSSPAMHSNSTALSLPREVLAESQTHSRLKILHALCESYRLQHTSLARLWYHVQTDEPSPYNSITWHDAGTDILDGWTCSRTISYGVASESLMDIRRSLDEWHTHLSSAEKPIDTIRCDIGPPRPDSLPIQPIRFITHLAAMKYAYYCAARVMTCSGASRLCDGLQRDANDHDADEDQWMMRLLQLAAGLNWSDCLRFNIHTIGIASLLFACVLRTTNPVIGAWVEDWMSRQGVSEDSEEGSFPNLQILQALRLVNAERCAGRDVLAVYQPIDDGGGVGKYGAYTSQNITGFLVFGRCRGTGRLYSRYSAV